MSAELVKSLITDRSATDAMLAEQLQEKTWDEMNPKEKAQWSTALKGCYNYTDLNRVEAVVEVLAERLIALGYDVSVETKTNWQPTDAPDPAEMLRYLSNVKMLCLNTLAIELPELPDDMRQLNHEYANNIELALLRLAEAIGIKEQTFNYFSGEIHAGEV